ncbi:pyridoxamine 5'-phosphate oxidase [Blastococcus sp. CT_GayMR19]|nr:pyridoxamine 5'-phosphate oxidase [Blastococcus sp. CT_GayMR19]
MTGPAPDRPWMPGYGVLPADQGSGLMAWAEAERRLTVSHDYWCATVRPDGRPHVMPVWGVWLDARLWFSTGMRSRKARDVAVEPRCTLTTDDARDPVVVDGVAEQVTDRAGIEGFVAAVNGKYGGGVRVDFLDPAVNGTFSVRPEWVFAISEDDFSGSPTRWRFPQPG